MRRVVVTGMGIVSSIGNNLQDVTGALRQGRSGIEYSEEYQELGFRSRIHGSIEVDLAGAIDRKQKRFMGDAAAYNYLAMLEAIQDSGLSQDVISSPRTGLVVGSGGGSPENISNAVDLLRDKGVKRVGPYMVTRTMASSTAACLGTAFKIKGVAYSISSACATSAHCIGNAGELIQMGKQDLVFAGGGEELHWTTTVLFDAMGALSSKYNDAPQTASRAYDADRDGFVISGGGGVLVMEELEHARNRGARIYAELVGYGATSDGFDMVQPSGEGAARCMEQAIAGLGRPVDYLNSHGTSTPVGDVRELEAISKVFGGDVPPISATKSLTGHALGAAGVNEAVYTLLMLEGDFIAASANIANIDPDAESFPIVRERQDNAGLNVVMSNSFGFGGTNSTLVFQRMAD
ncbi:MAG: beta-ketoacyl-[acyl-carrier-protein] synthase I [Proteobacteria bacterium]|nr:beta-ketoacyl-[acyl-carrier-protein] synthase I [Pseudomonadota bacterium]MBP09106.1 beta-ketoacyl-[acyl-carrier-protein] synthase I [Acidiferrobacteraceae bacterium]MDP7219317.1 beta-ketoacyl-ACP synthase I [Arenicellales bacterium]HCF74378.1 beta-ketoacyl-ACP synthase I [Gammaproteobacteria bacterium]HJP10511.1 beta-ketoacyl-ACP synthase I [Arenicellales bacterium]|tara:strand:+ start:43321 stop:44538 length:1218 start_codon:yes stop_codon:yes gene_type:complete